MRLQVGNSLEADVLVIGGGGAGLRAAVAAAETGARVLLLSDSRVGYGSLTAVAGGAFASVAPGRRDNVAHGWRRHFEDTVSGGRFLCDQELALTMTRDVPDEVSYLERHGATYATPDTAPWLRHSVDPGHHAAVMFYGRNAIGTDITVPLRTYAESLGVTLLDGTMVTGLILEEGRVLGALTLTRDGAVQAIAARATVLATGGMGQAYARTDNTPGATGDGYALAYKAGLPLRDMEYMQFYPAGLGSGVPGLFYEILVAGTGGRLFNSSAEDVLQLHGLDDPLSMTRDVLSIAIMKEVAAGRGVDGGVQLDLASVPDMTLTEIAPVLPKAALRGQRTFTVAPTAHTHLGGIVVTPRMETGLDGLYAAGEVVGGVHGANRLSGNAISDILVFGAIAGSQAAHRAAESTSALPDSQHARAERDRLQRLLRGGNVDSKSVRTALKQLMWTKAGVLRSEESLSVALKGLSELKASLRSAGAVDGRGLQHLLKTRNLLLSAELLCRSALARTESRGAHWRSDYPAEDDDWLRSVVIRRGLAGPDVSTRPVSLPHLQP
ncbi:FAD-dependent oxidoreductase [Chloroflexota bacterium]